MFKRFSVVILIADASMHGTPFHEKPSAWVASVDGRDANHELYGPFNSPAAAKEFCAHIPAMYTCEVTPILPKGEWMRKGAR